MTDCECKTWARESDDDDSEHHPNCPVNHEENCECIHCMIDRGELIDEDDVQTIEYVKKDDE
jgi:hypothetical protein